MIQSTTLYYESHCNFNAERTVNTSVHNSRKFERSLFRKLLSGILFSPISSSGHIEFFVWKVDSANGSD